jgi:hypothetical protein
MVTSPSRPPESSHLATDSIRSVSQMTRPRRDTTTTATSSDLSSDPEMDQAFVQRKPISSRRARATLLLTERIQEDEREGDPDLLDEDPGDESDTTISSAFVASVDSLGGGELADSLRKLPGMNTRPAPLRTSPKKVRANPPLQVLPGPRPISIAPPVSLLSKALNSSSDHPGDTLLKFATMSGKDSTNPVYIKILAPFSKSAGTKPFECILRRPNEAEKPFTVAAVIGFALWRYNDEKLEPALAGENMNVNKWNFRMVDDGEVEYDFPALARTASMADFTSRNNRGPARGRVRDKPWDEFALVEANEREFKDNETATPKYSEEWAAAQKPEKSAGQITRVPNPPEEYPVQYPPNQKPRMDDPNPFYVNPITGVFFHSDVYRNRQHRDKEVKPLPMDAPPMGGLKSRSRTAMRKTLNVRYVSERDLVARTTLIEVTTDTYLAEVLETACKRFNIPSGEKDHYLLKIPGSIQTVPEDRTVEALGEMADLDLQRRRLFVTSDGTVVGATTGMGLFGFPASPKSESPNAPIVVGGDGKKGKGTGSGKGTATSSLVGRYDPFAAMLGGPGIPTSGMAMKRYNVIRKQPMSFSSSSSKIIMLEAEFMHIMPSVGAKAMWEVGPGKSTTIPFGSVVGCKVSRKHPRMFRVTVFKEREQKRYDFEAGSPEEAVEIVEEIRKGMEGSKPTEGGMAY